MFDHQAFLASVTQQPGVYRMYDDKSTVIYVGKSKALKKRLTSYFRSNVDSPKTRALVKQITAIDVTVTNNEAEALLLEDNYIKKYQPKYNILLRDDKTYPYILLTDHKHPRLTVHRGSKKIKGEYFGPYTTVGAVWESLRLMQKLFPIRQCEDSYYRARSRPCLQYQLGRCSAPCVDKISLEDYKEQVDLSKLFLRGKSSTVIESLVDKMDEVSASLAFEKAAKYRDQIATLRKVQQQQYISGFASELDIIGFYRLNNQACIHLLFVRENKILGSKSYFPSIPAQANDSDILHAFISQYYLSSIENQRQLPKEIVVNETNKEINYLVELLSIQAKHSIKLAASIKQERGRYLKLANTNAENALNTRNSHKESIQARFVALNELFELNTTIKKLECFDISHTMGQQTVASCVVFNEEGPLNSAYRRYNVHGITPGDDYAAMDFALNKRYSKVTDAELFPDVVFIDGGKGQLARAETFFSQHLLDDIPLLVGVAKGESRKPGLETLILGGSHQLINLPNNSPALHLIQHIRDESHRFAITGHRAKRQKHAKTSVLESIPGIGAKKRQALLKYLGGLQEVVKADVDTLMKVPGINKTLAQLIYEHVHRA